jgi:hypothetical protein
MKRVRAELGQAGPLPEAVVEKQDHGMGDSLPEGLRQEKVQGQFRSLRGLCVDDAAGALEQQRFPVLRPMESLLHFTRPRRDPLD